MSNRRKIAQNCWIFGAEAYSNPSLKGKAFLSLPQLLPKGKGFSNFDISLYMRVYMTPRGSALDAVV